MFLLGKDYNGETGMVEGAGRRIQAKQPWLPQVRQNEVREMYAGQMARLVTFSGPQFPHMKNESSLDLPQKSAMSIQCLALQKC